MIGPFELLLIFIGVILVGPRRIGALFRALGRGVRDFGTEINHLRNRELDNEDESREPKERG